MLKHGAVFQARSKNSQQRLVVTNHVKENLNHWIRAGIAMTESELDEGAAYRFPNSGQKLATKVKLLDAGVHGQCRADVIQRLRREQVIFEVELLDARIGLQSRTLIPKTTPTRRPQRKTNQEAATQSVR